MVFYTVYGSVLYEWAFFALHISSVIHYLVVGKVFKPLFKQVAVLLVDSPVELFFQVVFQFVHFLRFYLVIHSFTCFTKWSASAHLSGVQVTFVIIRW